MSTTTFVTLKWLRRLHDPVFGPNRNLTFREGGPLRAGMIQPAEIVLVVVGSAVSIKHPDTDILCPGAIKTEFNGTHEGGVALACLHHGLIHTGRQRDAGCRNLGDVAAAIEVIQIWRQRRPGSFAEVGDAEDWSPHGYGQIS